MSETEFTQEEMENTHPTVPGLVEQLQQGRSTRREFLRTVTLLGASIGSATACTQWGAAMRVNASARSPIALGSI